MNIKKIIEYRFYEKDRDVALKMFNERFEKTLKRTKSKLVQVPVNIEISKFKNHFKTSKKSHLKDSIGSRMIGMKISELIGFLEEIKDNYGDCTLVKQSRVNMGICLVNIRLETQEEKEERIATIIYEDIRRELNKRQSIEFEKESLRKRLQELEMKEV